jgi:hypothetical protein
MKMDKSDRVALIAAHWLREEEEKIGCPFRKGRYVKIKINEEREFTGKIKRMDDEKILLDEVAIPTEDVKRYEKVEKNVECPKEDECPFYRMRKILEEENIPIITSHVLPDRGILTIETKDIDYARKVLDEAEIPYSTKTPKVIRWSPFKEKKGAADLS